MGINLLKKLGYMYYGEYYSVFADNDLTEMTKLMKKYVFIDKAILLHVHPVFNLCEYDEQYRKNESQEHYINDGNIFKKRKQENFGL